MCPIAQANGHDCPGLVDQLVPGIAAVLDDVVIGSEEAVREPVVVDERYALRHTHPRRRSRRRARMARPLAGRRAIRDGVILSLHGRAPGPRSRAHRAWSPALCAFL